MIDPGLALRYFQGRRTQMLQQLEELVNRESPSTEKEAVDHLGLYVESLLKNLGLTTERLPRCGLADVLRASRPASAQDRKPVLLLAHMDTVWPLGTLAHRPFQVRDDIAAGPGCLDDKSGILVALEVMLALDHFRASLPRPVTLLFNGDEETGSKSSRSAIEAEAKQSAFVLSLEPAGEDGALKTSRRAAGRFTMEVTGKPAHSGEHAHLGVSAVEELARQILDLHAWSDQSTGIRVNVGVISGGTRPNVVAGSAHAEIDARAASAQQVRDLRDRFAKIAPHHPQALVKVTGDFDRPVMERTRPIAELYSLARRLAASFGLDLKEIASGASSDANFTAALGIPTLDGLGGTGAGLHAAHEYVLVDQLPQRMTLLLLLLQELSLQTD